MSRYSVFMRESLSWVYGVLSAGSLVEVVGACGRVRMVNIVVGWNGKQACFGSVVVRISIQVLLVADIGKLRLTHCSCRFAARTDRCFVNFCIRNSSCLLLESTKHLRVGLCVIENKDRVVFALVEVNSAYLCDDACIQDSKSSLYKARHSQMEKYHEHDRHS